MSRLFSPSERLSLVRLVALLRFGSRSAFPPSRDRPGHTDGARVVSHLRELAWMADGGLMGGNGKLNRSFILCPLPDDHNIGHDPSGRGSDEARFGEYEVYKRKRWKGIIRNDRRRIEYKPRKRSCLVDTYLYGWVPTDLSIAGRR